MGKILISVILLIFIIFPGLIFASSEEKLNEAVAQCMELAREDLDQFAGKDRDRLWHHLLMGYFCTGPEISSRLGATEKNRIQEIAGRYQEAKKSLSKKELAELEQMEAYMKARWEEEMMQGRPYGEKELAFLDAHLRSVWGKMVEALRKKDVDQAVVYFARKNRETYRQQFSALKDRLPDMAKEMMDIQLIRLRTPREAVYDLMALRGGQIFSFQLIFIKEADDEWRILTY